MSLRFTAPYFLWIDGNGVPANGWKLFFYESGTNTPQDTYSNVGLTVPNANPVVANADGYWGPIFLSLALYKVVLTDADGDLIWTADPVSGSASDGIIKSNIRTTTISSNITDSDGTVLVNSSGATTQTLPAAADVEGIIFTVKNINSGVVTVAGTIDDATNFAMPFLNQSASFQSDGVSYYIV